MHNDPGYDIIDIASSQRNFSATILNPLTPALGILLSSDFLVVNQISSSQKQHTLVGIFKSNKGSGCNTINQKNQPQ
jgi:hypothetical protein